MKRTIWLLIVVGWILIPTGTPDDLFITIPLIKWLGVQVYAVMIMILLGLLLYHKVTFKQIKTEIDKTTKKISKKVKQLW